MGYRDKHNKFVESIKYDIDSTRIIVEKNKKNSEDSDDIRELLLKKVSEERNMHQNLDLSFENQERIIRYYLNIVTELSSRSVRMINELTGYVRKYDYLPLKEGTDAFIYYHNEDLKRFVLTAIEKWRNSENSLSATLREFGAGELAISNAKRLEIALSDIAANNFKKISEAVTDQGQPNKIDQAVIEEVCKKITLYIERVADYKNQTIKELRNKMQESVLYGNIAEMIIDTFNADDSGLESIEIVFQEIATNFGLTMKKTTQIANDGIGRGVKNVNSQPSGEMKSKIHFIRGK